MTTPAKVQRYDLPRCGDPDCEMMERAEDGYYIEASDYDNLARCYAALEQQLAAALAPPSQREILDTGIRCGIGEDEVVASFIAARRARLEAK